MKRKRISFSFDSYQIETMLNDLLKIPYAMKLVQFQMNGEKSIICIFYHLEENSYFEISYSKEKNKKRVSCQEVHLSFPLKIISRRSTDMSRYILNLLMNCLIHSSEENYENTQSTT
jgi:hypothetical protein